jgi:hypothetical protein
VTDFPCGVGSCVDGRGLMVAVLEMVRIERVQALRMLNRQLVVGQDGMPCLEKEGNRGEVGCREPP